MRDVEALLEAPTPPQCLLFDFQRVRWLDSSASQVFGRLFKLARRHGVQVDLSHLSASVRRALQAAGGLGADGPTVHADIDAAVCAWDDAALALAQVPEETFEARLAASLPPGTPAAQVMAYFEPLTLAPGDVLFTQGEASDALYLVQAGRLSAYVQVGGQAVAVRAIHAGGAIGEMGLFRATPRSATLRADQDSVVLRLRRGQLEALESRHPALAASLYRLFLGQLAGRLDQLTAQANALSV
jgi:SulP family sulfate permease